MSSPKHNPLDDEGSTPDMLQLSQRRIHDITSPQESERAGSSNLLSGTSEMQEVEVNQRALLITVGRKHNLGGNPLSQGPL